MNKENTFYATFWERLLAQNIDLTILLGLFYLYSLVPTTTYDAIAFVIITILYQSLFELSPWKATPGKKWTQLQVVQVESKLPYVLAVFSRSLGKFISLLALFAGFAMISHNTRKQGLHDYIAGTVVLSNKN